MNSSHDQNKVRKSMAEASWGSLADPLHVVVSNAQSEARKELDHGRTPADAAAAIRTRAALYLEAEHKATDKRLKAEYLDAVDRGVALATGQAAPKKRVRVNSL